MQIIHTSKTIITFNGKAKPDSLLNLEKWVHCVWVLKFAPQKRRASAEAE
jgi:hypothetical protein